jgi:glucose/arabinose dehydrogenase
VAAFVSAGLSAAHAAADIQVPAGFQADTAMDDLEMPTTLDFAPDGRIFVAEAQGRILVFDDLEDDNPEVFADITVKVHGFLDRGLLGLALDPDFPAKPYVYVAYTHDAVIGGTAPLHGGAGGSDDCPDLDPDQEESCVVSGRISRFELEPGTGRATTDGDGEPVEQVLVESWCQQYSSHSVGDLEFRPGTRELYVSGGDGANYLTADIGQLDGNPCADPPNEGGALRALDLLTPATPTDPTDYGGTVLAVDPDTGTALPSNPLIAGADVAARRILAYGLRNPFRMEFRPGSDDLYVQDTGWSTFEEVDRILDHSTVPNFGWPCYEGPDRTPAYDLLDVPLCESLYSAQPSPVTAPFYVYGNKTLLYPGDTCSPDPGSAGTGLFFYQGVHFPPAYSGALFMASAPRGCIWSMRAGPGGHPNPATVEAFAVSTEPEELEFTPVDLVEGPDGALYAADFFNGRIVRFRHFAGNQPPVASLTADRYFGSVPLPVQFDAGASADADGDPLLFAWDLDGDGEFDDASGSEPTVARTYTDGASNVLARVRVSDSYAADVAEMRLFPGDRPPDPAIEVPNAGLRWAVGDRIIFAGRAGDPDQGALPGSALHWRITLHHCRQTCHAHPLTEREGVAAGSFRAPDHELGSYLTIALTATDDRGLSAQAGPLRLDPRAIEVTLRSNPAGVPLSRDGETGTAPFSLPMIAGASATITAPPTARVDGRGYAFSRWSDGGARGHTIRPLGDIVLTAFYSPGSGPKLARVRFDSRPRGLPLHLGKAIRRGPFTRLLPVGSKLRLAAPRRVKLNGRLLAFESWSTGGRRVQTLHVRRPRSYVARYQRASPSRRRSAAR